MDAKLSEQPLDKRMKTDKMHTVQNGPSKLFLPERIRIGSRKSQLSLFQSNYVRDLLRAIHPEIKYEIVAMSTTGDNILDKPLSKIGEKGLFTKELEVALEANVVDVVVHSLKDLPTCLPEGMVIGAICKRASPFDTVVLSPKNIGKCLESLPEGSVIGTSSLRRIAQLKHAYPHMMFESVRGNLNTRLRKLDEDNIYDALILAAAGMERLDLSKRISSILSTDVCMYAVGQGALAVECKSDDSATLKLLSEFADADTTLCCIAERAFMKTLEGGCSVPVAVCSSIKDNELSLKGGVFSLDGKERIIKNLKVQMSEITRKRKAISVENNDGKKHFCGIVACQLPEQHLVEAQKLGTELAQSLLESGAGKLLEKARSQNLKS